MEIRVILLLLVSLLYSIFMCLLFTFLGVELFFKHAAHSYQSVQLKMRTFEALAVLLIISINNFPSAVDGDPIGTGGPAVVTEGKDALLTCVITGPYQNDTVIWRKGTEILAAGKNRVTGDKRISVLHDDGKCFTVYRIIFGK